MLDLQKKDEIALNTLVTNESIRSKMPEWDSFSEEDRKFFKEEIVKIMDERVKLGMSALAIGESLSEIRRRLAPRRLFTKFVENGLNFSRATANEYIANYERVRDILPAAGLQTAMAMGLKIHGDKHRPLGIFTEATKTLMPPKGNDTRQWRAYWEEAETRRRRLVANSVERRQGVEYDPEFLLKAAYRFVIRMRNKLPKGKRRKDWTERLSGMLFSDLGVSNLTIAAEAAPDDFKAVVGRPRKAVGDE